MATKSRSAKTDSRSSKKKSKGVDRSQEGKGGPTVTSAGETSTNVEDRTDDGLVTPDIPNTNIDSGESGKNFPGHGLEDIGGTGTDMDEAPDAMDFDETENRQRGPEKSRRQDDEGIE